MVLPKLFDNGNVRFTSLVNIYWCCVSQHVDIEFGTGVLKISPGHDHNDYLLARKLGLPILNVMNKDGTLNEVGGMYSLEL
jgi:valyl-tRNA synthetase